MLKLELNKASSKRIREIVGRILEVQEERCAVVKTQLKMALNDPRFAEAAAKCRDRAAPYPQRDKAWGEMMALLPSKRLDFASMRQDAISYYGDGSDGVKHGLVGEVVRETYDLMTLFLYDNQDFDSGSYNITGLEGGRCFSDGLHHFYCDVVFDREEIALGWGTVLREPLALDKKICQQLTDQFARFEFGCWEICPENDQLSFNTVNEGSKIPDLKIRKCAAKEKFSLKPQPFYGEHIRRCAELMLANPDFKQTAFKDIAAAQDTFGTGSKDLDSKIAVMLYKRLSVLHEPILELLPELNSGDLALMNVIARMRSDYLFYLFMELAYLRSAGMVMLDDTCRFVMENEPGITRRKPSPTGFEILAVDFFNTGDPETIEADEEILNEMLNFMEAAGLVGCNEYGQFITTPREMNPQLMNRLLEYGYGAYLRPLLGHYKYEQPGGALDFLETLADLFGEAEGLI